LDEQIAEVEKRTKKSSKSLRPIVDHIKAQITALHRDHREAPNNSRNLLESAKSVDIQIQQLVALLGGDVVGARRRTIFGAAKTVKYAN
jgi:hypothetical protein